MKQGMVVKIKKSYAILMTNENTFVRLKIKKNMQVGQKIYFLEDDIVSTKKEYKMKNKVIAIGAIAAILMLSIIGMNLMPTSTYALVSLDINPSMDIKIDIDHKVLEIIPLNNEASQIFSSDMIGRPIMDVIEKIIDNAKIEKYLTDDNNNILISSAVLNDGDIEELGNLITNHLENDMKVPENIRVIYIESDKETAETSLEDGVSLGKLELAKITKEDTSKKTITEIVENETVDVELAENIVIEDDNLENSLQTFISKLRVIPAEDESDLSNFLKLFNEDNLPIQEDADLQAYLVLAKTYWKPLMDEYQKTWVATSQKYDDDDDLIESRNEFIYKLRLIKSNMPSGENYDKINEWLTAYDGNKNPGTTLEIKNQARDLVNTYKSGYQHLWDDDDDYDDDDYDDDDLEELKEYLAKLDDYPEMAAFLEKTRLEISTASRTRLQELKDEAKGYFKSYNEKNRHDWDDQDEVLEELVELNEEYGHLEIVKEFIDLMMEKLENTNDYDQLLDEIDDFEDSLEAYSSKNDVIEELDELKDEYGHLDGVQEFINTILVKLENSVDYDLLLKEIDAFENTLDDDDSIEELLEELDELYDLYGHIDGGHEFILEMQLLLSLNDPDLSFIEDAIDDYKDELEDLRGKGNGKNKANDHDDNDNNDNDNDDNDNDDNDNNDNDNDDNDNNDNDNNDNDNDDNDNNDNNNDDNNNDDNNNDDNHGKSNNKGGSGKNN